jgi:hypothetical protein
LASERPRIFAVFVEAEVLHVPQNLYRAVLLRQVVQCPAQRHPKLLLFQCFGWNFSSLPKISGDVRAVARRSFRLEYSKASLLQENGADFKTLARVKDTGEQSPIAESAIFGDAIWQ